MGVMRLSYRLNIGRNHKISLDAAKTRFFNTFTTREISARLFYKPLQRGRCDAALLYYSMRRTSLGL